MSPPRAREAGLYLGGNASPPEEEEGERHRPARKSRISERVVPSHLVALSTARRDQRRALEKPRFWILHRRGKTP